MKKTVLAVTICLILAGCGKDPIQVSQTDNEQVKAQKLFTHDGITVYRFTDYGRAVYFTSRGDASYKSTEYCGKGCWREVAVQTLGRE